MCSLAAGAQLGRASATSEDTGAAVPYDRPRALGQNDHIGLACFLSTSRDATTFGLSSIPLYRILGMVYRRPPL